MIAQKIERFRRAFWTWKQPLTSLPAQAAAPISDLFIWRNSGEWQTSFELIDISALFSDDTGTQRYVTLLFFDQNGHHFLEKRVALLRDRRQTLDISSMVGESNGAAGTFAVFHSTTPPAVTKMGSFLAERGYISYRFRGAPLRSYVHGNLDAIAPGPGGRLELLGSTSWLPREYRLQHAMQGSVLYELALVNPTSFEQSYSCELESASGRKIQGLQKIRLGPGGIHFLSFPIDQAEPVRAVIKSRLIMARPLVFRIQNSKLDVFHG